MLTDPVLREHLFQIQQRMTAMAGDAPIEQRTALASDVMMDLSIIVQKLIGNNLSQFTQSLAVTAQDYLTSIDQPQRTRDTWVMEQIRQGQQSFLDAFIDEEARRG